VEVGGFAVTAEHDPLYVQQFITVAQQASTAFVAFDDAAVADYFEDCVDRGLTPNRFARIWCHTHPGSSPRPSLTDEDTFARVFGNCHWAVMFILSRTHETYARLRFGSGPGGQIELDVAVDWEAWPAWVLENSAAPRSGEGLFEVWAAEYAANVRRRVEPFPRLVEPAAVDWEQLEEDLELVGLDLPAGALAFSSRPASGSGTKGAKSERESNLPATPQCDAERRPA